MTEKYKEEFDNILDSLCDYQFDARHNMMVQIEHVVEDKKIREQLIEDCDKEFHLALNMIEFVRANAENFVAFCKHEKNNINKRQ